MSPHGCISLYRTAQCATPYLPIHTCAGGPRHSLIVIDPPWENRSVKRGGQYGMLPANRLLSLPVPQLLDQVRQIGMTPGPAGFLKLHLGLFMKCF